MNRFAFAAALFLLTCSATAQPPTGKKKTDLELIQGTWWIVGLESGGKIQSEKGIKGNSLVFARNNSTDTVELRELGYGKVEFSYNLDPSKSPKAIDLGTKNSKALGIYKLDGDDLSICMSLGGNRPTEFATKAGGDTELFTLRRNRWERFSEKVHGFSIDFPGRPAESKRMVEIPAGPVVATSFTVQSEMERTAYKVVVTPLSGRVTGREAEDALQDAQKSLLAEIDPEATAKVEAESTPGKQPPGIAAAREFTISFVRPRTLERVVTRVRLYVAGDRLYSLIVSGGEEATKSPNVQRFWGSFRTPADKAKGPPGKQ